MKLHYYIRGGILFGLTSYIVYLVQLDKLHYYIVPRMAPYMKLSVIALYMLALYCIYLAWQEKGKHEHTRESEHSHEHQHIHEHDDHNCSCQHEVPRSKTKSVLLYSIFIVPLLLGFAMPDQLMGSDIAAVKGMNLSASNGASLQQTKVADLDSFDVQVPSVEGSLEASTGSDPKVDLEAENKATVEADAKAGATVDIEGSGDVNQDDEVVDQSANEMETKNASNSLVSSTDDDQSFDALFPSDQYSVELAELGKLLYQKDIIAVKEEGFLETLTSLDLYRDNFIGKTIRISGFVYREDDMSEDTFVISRMAMQCCSADASPYGFLVQWDDANAFEKDKWIEVIGTFGLTEYNGIEIVQLKATEITTIEAPNDPYVYPYFDDFVKIAEE